MNKNKLKSIIDDIWRNFKVPLIIGVLFNILFIVHKDEMDLEWFIFGMLISNATFIASITYGVMQYFKK